MPYSIDWTPVASFKVVCYKPGNCALSGWTSAYRYKAPVPVMWVTGTEHLYPHNTYSMTGDVPYSV